MKTRAITSLDQCMIDPNTGVPAWALKDPPRQEISAPSAHQKVRDVLAGLRLDNDTWRASLSVILCEHFACLSDCPDDGEVDDNGWHPWAVERCERMLDQLARAAVGALPADVEKASKP